jgi:hypothetical protein
VAYKLLYLTEQSITRKEQYNFKILVRLQDNAKELKLVNIYVFVGVSSEAEEKIR